LPFKVNCLPLVHSTYTLGYSVEIENKKISFCTDTGYCDNVIKLSQNADIMITECSFESNKEDEKWPHLNPELAAKMAVKANAQKLYLMHFEASQYLFLKDRKKAEEKARKIFVNTHSSYDDMVIDLY
jgi:ribonuclease BN (tRNA processing enzyme)